MLSRLTHIVLGLTVVFLTLTVSNHAVADEKLALLVKQAEQFNRVGMRLKKGT